MASAEDVLKAILDAVKSNAETAGDKDVSPSSAQHHAAAARDLAAAYVMVKEPIRSANGGRTS